MTQRNLATLVAVVDSGSFASAARAMNMTVSAVSMQMKGLENELGADLFDRRFRPPKLTPIGRRVAQEARAILSAYQTLTQLCHAPGSIKGDFRIGFVLTCSVRLLPGFLASARETFPGAQFQVETGLSDELLDRVTRGALDAAIITGGEDLPPGTRETLLTWEELVYCLPTTAADWPVARCMADLPFIHFMPQAGIGRLIARHLAAAHLVAGETIVLDTVEAVAECVRHGVGFGILPKPDVVRYARGDIVLRSMAEPIIKRALVLVTREGTALDADAPVLAQALIAQI